MAKAKPKNNSFWFIVGLVGVLLEAPNATALRVLTFDMDPFALNVIRFSIVGVLMLPFILLALPKLKKHALRDTLLAGINMSIAIIAFTWALKTGPASYVSIITLLTPIMLVLFSVRLVREKVNKRSIAGITLAAIGAMVIVVLPIAASGGGSFVFYPESTVLALINCVTFALAIIYSKRANEAGVSMTAIIGIYAWLAVVVNLAAATLSGVAIRVPSGENLLLIVYSGVGVGLIVRAMSVLSYEHIGSAATGALSYVGSLASVLIPVFILGEKLSPEMVIGGILILLGIYVIEYHKSTHHKHHHALKTH